MEFRYSFSFVTQQRHVLMIRHDNIIKYSLNGSMSCNIIEIEMSTQCTLGQDDLTQHVFSIFISLGWNKFKRNLYNHT